MAAIPGTMIALIVPTWLDIIMILLAIGALGGLVYIIQILFVQPALEVKAEQDSPPPNPGDVHQILIDGAERVRRLSIGLLDADIKVRMIGIKEDQLVLTFKKDRELEEYDIQINPGSNIFYRPPHGKKIEPLKENESIESRELIGHAALFRVAATVKNNRPLQYLEFELSSKFIFNKIGEEKMQFSLELLRIFPGMEENSRDKKGLFAWSRFQAGEESTD